MQQSLGQELRKIRKQAGQSLLTVAGAIGVDRSYLNKIELDATMPSRDLLVKLINHFSVDSNVSRLLFVLGGFESSRISGYGAKGVSAMQNNELQQTQSQPQISVDPAKSQVLYTDSVFVNSSNYGLVLDVAQVLGGAQHHVVARIGMSFDHAKELVKVINDHLEKHER